MNRTIQRKVIPNSKLPCVVKINGILKVYVNASATENKANIAIVKVLSEYLKVKKNNLIIVSGLKSRNKIIQLKS